jgi:hypothetical protein
MNTEIHHFDDLLDMARAQRERQRLLFVFVGTELPENATAEQRACFDDGDGGALVPLMCADKLPEDVASFEMLLAESQQFEHPGRPWQLVFTAALGGTTTDAPAESDVGPVLDRMVEAVKTGMLDSYLPFNRNGEPVRLQGRGGD